MANTGTDTFLSFSKTVRLSDVESINSIDDTRSGEVLVCIAPAHAPDRWYHGWVPMAELAPILFAGWRKAVAPYCCGCECGGVLPCQCCACDGPINAPAVEEETR